MKTNLTQVFNETVRKTRSTRKVKAKRNLTSKNRLQQELETERERAKKELEQLTDAATKTIRDICAAEQKIAAAVLKQFTEARIHVARPNRMQHENGILLTDPDSGIALEFPCGGDRRLWFSSLQTGAKFTQLHQGLAEALKIVPVEKGHEPAYGIIWREVLAGSVTQQAKEILRKLAIPLEAVRIIAQAVA